MSDFWQFIYYFLAKFSSWAAYFFIDSQVTLLGFVVAVSVFGVVISTLLSYGRFVSRRDFTSFKGGKGHSGNNVGRNS